MGDKNINDTDACEANVSDEYCSPQHLRPVPPIEAFQQVDGMQRLSEKNNEDNIRNINGNGDNKQLYTQEKFVASSARMNTATSSQRPALLMRRQSSLFGQLPIRNRSRLFDDIVSCNSEANNISKINNTIGNNFAAETTFASATNFSCSQSTWLQEDHQSSFIGEDNKSQTMTKDSEIQEQNQTGKSSLFGAVMRQFGSSISSNLPSHPLSPYRNRQQNNTLESSSQKSDSGTTSAHGGGGLRDLMASPSGKTIMNIVNQFNSPFKFQSPSSSHKKRQRRLRLWGDGGNDGEADTFSTPKKLRRMQMDEEDEISQPSSNALFPDNDNADSRSSLGGGLVDEHWQEAPIIDSEGKDRARMEVLDWSLATKVRIEVHGGNPQQLAQPIMDTWIRDTMRENEEFLSYWMYESPIVHDHSICTPQSNGLTSYNNSSSNLAVIQKSIGVSKTSMSRQGPSSSRFDQSLQNSKINGKNKNNDEIESPDGIDRVAKYLIQSVRGPNARHSRKRTLAESSWWDEKITPTRPVVLEDSTERSAQQWQQGLRSLFSNFRCRVLHNNNSKESFNTIVLDTYFYCIGQDHSVLFRIDDDRHGDNNKRTNGESGKAVPMVLVSSTSDAFRKQLELNGMDLIHNIDSEESFQLLESIQERESRVRKKISAATAAAMQKNKGFFDNVLLSPGVRADLEALRRAQAFGESAGADVFVKLKKSGAASEDGVKGNEILPKAIRVSGWDNIALFLEVYINLFGDTMSTDDNPVTAPFSSHISKASRKRLPLLICPNTKGFGPFEHASLRRLRLFPAERIPTTENNIPEKKNETEQPKACHGNAMEIGGILLPCTIRKLLLVTRNRILDDAKRASPNNSLQVQGGNNRLTSEVQSKNNDSDCSRYVVLHSTRPAIFNSHKESSQSWIVGLNGSLIFNQGKEGTTKTKSTTENHVSGKVANHIFECLHGKVVSMAVWDTSREEVAACKLDDAFPENWIYKK